MSGDLTFYEVPRYAPRRAVLAAFFAAAASIGAFDTAGRTSTHHVPRESGKTHGPATREKRIVILAAYPRAAVVPVTQPAPVKIRKASHPPPVRVGGAVTKPFPAKSVASKLAGAPPAAPSFALRETAAPAMPTQPILLSPAQPLESNWTTFAAKGREVRRIPKLECGVSDFNVYRAMFRRNRITLVFARHSQIGERALFWDAGASTPYEAPVDADTAAWLHVIENAAVLPEFRSYLSRAETLAGPGNGREMRTYVLYSAEVRDAVLGKVAAEISRQHGRPIEDAESVFLDLFQTGPADFDLRLKTVVFRNANP